MKNFGPLIAFFVVNYFWGLKPAIVASLAVGLVECARGVWMKEKTTIFFWFSLGTMLLFGAVDLYADTPILFKYEAAVNSLLFGLFFGATLLVGRPLIEEFAEKTLPPERIAQPRVKEYLKFLTGVWTAYFFAKAGFYVYLAESMTIEKAMAVRATFGAASMTGLLVGERLVRTQIIALLKKVGYFRNH